MFVATVVSYVLSVRVARRVCFSVFGLLFVLMCFRPGALGSDSGVCEKNNTPFARASAARASGSNCTPVSLSLSLSLCIYIYMYIYTYTHSMDVLHTYIYIYVYMKNNNANKPQIWHSRR